MTPSRDTKLPYRHKTTTQRGKRTTKQLRCFVVILCQCFIGRVDVSLHVCTPIILCFHGRHVCVFGLNSPISASWSRSDVDIIFGGCQSVYGDKRRPVWAQRIYKERKLTCRGSWPSSSTNDVSSDRTPQFIPSLQFHIFDANQDIYTKSCSTEKQPCGKFLLSSQRLVVFWVIYHRNVLQVLWYFNIHTVVQLNSCGLRATVVDLDVYHRTYR